MALVAGVVCTVALVVTIAACGLLAALAPSYVRWAWATKRWRDGEHPVWPEDFPPLHTILGRTKRHAIANERPFAIPAWQHWRLREAAEEGHLYLGRALWPIRPFPGAAIGSLRARVADVLTSLFEQEVFLPSALRREHVLLVGPPGGAKTAGYVTRWIIDAAKSRTLDGYIFIDLKSPEFASRFRDLFAREDGRRSIIVYDPFCPRYSVAWEPLHSARARDEVERLANSIASLSQALDEKAGKDPFWPTSGRALFEMLSRLATYWPLRMSNLYCLTTLCAAGGDRIKLALRNCNGESGQRLLPEWDAMWSAFRAIVPAHPHVLLDDVTRPAELTAHLDVLERAGYGLLQFVRRMRAEVAARPEGFVDPAGANGILEQYAARVRAEWEKASSGLRELRDEAGTHLKSPEETFNSIVATVAPAARQLRLARGIALYLSRAEFRTSDLTAKPAPGRAAPILLLGASAAHKDRGSFAVAQAVVNDTLGAIATRSNADPTDPNLSKHTIHFVLDEFKALKFPKDTISLAVNQFRGLGAALAIVIQNKDQLQSEYTTQGAAEILNGVSTKIVLPQLSPEHAKELEKVVGTASVRTRTMQPDGSQRSEARQHRPRMTEADLTYLAVNGMVQPDPTVPAAFVQTKSGWFLGRAVRYYLDPRVRDELRLQAVAKPSGTQWLTPSEISEVNAPILERYPIPSIFPDGSADDVAAAGQPIRGGSHLLGPAPAETTDDVQSARVAFAGDGSIDRTELRPRDPYFPLLYHLLGGFCSSSQYDAATGRRADDARLLHYELKHPAVWTAEKAWWVAIGAADDAEIAEVLAVRGAQEAQARRRQAAPAPRPRRPDHVTATGETPGRAGADCTTDPLPRDGDADPWAAAAAAAAAVAGDAARAAGIPVVDPVCPRYVDAIVHEVMESEAFHATADELLAAFDVEPGRARSAAPQPAAAGPVPTSAAASVDAGVRAPADRPSRRSRARRPAAATLDPRQPLPAPAPPPPDFSAADED